ncbi:MAG TPA: hypothetical protein VF062_01835, partial [Candidatus Limnocylindrales bacterium]
MSPDAVRTLTFSEAPVGGVSAPPCMFRSLTVRPDAVLLDGNHDYLSVPEQSALFGPPDLSDDVPPVTTMIKA